MPPTEWNARTGELTPPGITAHASAYNLAETATSLMGTSVPAGTDDTTAGDLITGTKVPCFRAGADTPGLVKLA